MYVEKEKEKGKDVCGEGGRMKNGGISTGRNSLYIYTFFQGHK